MSVGNSLYELVARTQAVLFQLGEGVQLAYDSFELMSENIKSSDKDKIEIQYPLGLNPHSKPIAGEREYSKDELVDRYTELSATGLPQFGIYQIVTLQENLFVELPAEVLRNYPKKLGKRKSIPASVIFEASSIEEAQSAAIASFLNELVYKSPRDFADAVSEVFGFNLLEIPAFHRYIEVKATRDIYIHNMGVANETYLTKAGSHARHKSGQLLPKCEILP